ncbi:MAG TPA: ABC transporter permease [Candidatus Angelobacter sp.]|jgi:putative ABC transport system permease protein
MLAWLRSFASRLRGSFHPPKSDRELREELRAHADMLAEENIRRGVPAEEARRQASLALGSRSRIQEEYRDQAGLPFLEVLMQDLRYAVRVLRKSPAFAVVAIITLSLGIGANAAIFSVVNGVLLRPLPYEDPSRLVYVFSHAPERGLPDSVTSPPDFRTLRERNRTLVNLSALYTASFNLATGQQPERLRGEIVSSEYFTTLGVKPMIGRAFLPQEEKWGEHRVVVLSEGFWRSHLNGDQNINGKTLNLNGESYNVVGVMPASFYTPTPAVFWLPMAWKPKDNADSHNNYFLTMVGRLKPGTSQPQARADLDAIMLSIAQQFPENKGIGADVQSMSEIWVGDVRLALMVLLGAVGFVLLIACVNVANLALARSTSRQKEIAIRAALGAGRKRLFQQFLTESVLLSLIGGACGLGLAYISLQLLPLARNILPRMQQIQLDGWVLLFTFLISVLTGVFFGLLPAVQNAHVQGLNDTLKEGGRTSDSSSKSGLRKGLVVTEVALALVLLVCAGLALKSFSHLLHADRGFNADHVLSFVVPLPDVYDPDQGPGRIGAPPRVVAFFQEFLTRIEQLPRVKAAGAVSSLPLQGETWGKYFVPLDRPLPTSTNQIADIQYRAVAGHYFSAMGIPLLKGRFLNEHDLPNSPYSVVVNETLARRFWPGQDPIGKIVLLNPPENLIPKDQFPPGFHVQHFSVVGVVADVHYGSLNGAPLPTVYASVQQHDYSMGPFITVRADGDPKTLVDTIRSQLAQFDNSLPMARILTMDEVVSESAAQPRLEAILLGSFGLLALVLAAIGIYGVMSYTVTQRSGEIGIRMALGASRPAVLGMVISQGLRLAAVGLGIGLALGLILAFALKRVLANLLFGVSATDPATFAAIIALLALVALLACFIPARRATKVDPMVALRYE